MHTAWAGRQAAYHGVGRMKGWRGVVQSVMMLMWEGIGVGTADTNTVQLTVCSLWLHHGLDGHGPSSDTGLGRKVTWGG